jgi:predicted porin
MMNKTLLSLMAAAGLIASGSALADSSLVEIYGTFNVDFENVKATGGTAVGTPAPAGQMNAGAVSGSVQPSRNRVTQNSSNLGFRGKEDLGLGWNAIFQVESGINFPAASTTTTTAGTTSVGFFASRNSNVGLSSSTYGTVFYGNWDTPYKSLTNTVAFDSFYGTGIANDNTMIGTPGFGVASITAAVRNTNTSDASFDRRQGNSVQYWTPNWAGFSARFAYSTNSGRSTETTPPSAINISPTIYSASLAYETGPFRVSYGFEQHRDYFGLTQLGGAAVAGTNTTSRDNGNKVTLSYQLWGTTSINMAWERLSYNTSATTAGNLIHYHRVLVYAALKHKIGNGTIRVGFGDAHQGSCDRAGATACSTTGLDARQYSVGYSYSLSKRTDLYTFYTRVNNGTFATYQLGNGAGLGSAAGAHDQGFGLGMRHVF